MIKSNFTYSIKTVLLVSVFLCNKLVGQTYVFNPGTLFIAMVDTSQLNFNGIELTNTGTQNLNLTWELTLKDTLIDSNFNLCNSGACFNTLPVSGTKATITPGQKGWLKLHMFSGRINGLNTIKYVLRNGTIQIDTLTFKIYVGNTTSIKDLKNSKDLVTMYPNPTSNDTELQLHLSETSDVTLNTLNSLGQSVYKETLHGSVGLNSLVLETKNYDSGIYTILIHTKNGTITKKLTVTK